LEETARLVEKVGAATCIVPTDVSEQSQVEDMVRQTLESFSTIDILVNNAGLAGPVGPLQENDAAYWSRTILVNVIGVFLCCRAALPAMISNNRGKIINVYGGRGRGTSSYGASKVAVADITETLAIELAGNNIQVNALSPGSINTRMWEETRDAAQAAGDQELFEYGQRVTSGGGASIDRAAELAVFFASDSSGTLSGRVIPSMTEDLSTLGQRVPAIMASDAYTLRLLGPE
jgi:3-oxoacyl-[acyl-carrier protein] reductase